MKNKKILIILSIVFILLIAVGLVTSYMDSARVRNGVEPKFTIKITTDGGNKITYWGLGYKVVRYPAVSPKEPYKNSLGVKYGSWFMNYKLSNLETIDVELLMDGEKIQITRTRDIEFIVNLTKNSKYNRELCDGINTHKITIGKDIYYIKDSCKEIQKGKKQAEISDADLNKFLSIIEYYQNQNVTLEDLNNVNNEIINYFSSDKAEYKNLAFNYIDEEKKVVIVGLIENTEEQQKEFKNEVVDSHLIEFVQGSENINLPKYK